MKYLAIVIAVLGLGIVTLFFVNSSDADATGAAATVEEPFVATASPTQIAHYTFDEAGGAVINDAAGFNHGGASGKYLREKGVQGNAIVLEEAQIEISDQPQLNYGLNSYSLSVWVNFENDSSIWIDKRDFQNQPKVVEGKFGGTFDHYVPLAGYSLWITEHETDGTFINFFINQVDAEFKLQTHLADKNALNDSQWHQIVITVDPGKTDGLIAYVDGVAIAQEDLSDLTQPYDSTSPMFMYGRGEIVVDEISFFDQALSASQVADRFAAQK